MRTGKVFGCASPAGSAEFWFPPSSLSRLASTSLFPGAFTLASSSAALLPFPSLSCSFACCPTLTWPSGVAPRLTTIACLHVGQLCCRSSHVRRHWKWKRCPHCNFFTRWPKVMSSLQMMQIGLSASSSSVASGNNSSIREVMLRAWQNSLMRRIKFFTDMYKSRNICNGIP